MFVGNLNICQTTFKNRLLSFIYAHLTDATVISSKLCTTYLNVLIGLYLQTFLQIQVDFNSILDFSNS